MIEWTRHGLDPRYFVPAGSAGIAERRPDACPDGHAWGPDKMLVSAYPCACSRRPHRIWHCWTCARVWVRPACALHPEWVCWLPDDPDAFRDQP